MACKSRRTGFSRESGLSGEKGLVIVPTCSRLKPVLRDAGLVANSFEKGGSTSSAFVSTQIPSSRINSVPHSLHLLHVECADIALLVKHHLRFIHLGTQIFAARVQSQLMERRKAAQLDLAVRVAGALVDVYGRDLHQIDVIR